MKKSKETILVVDDSVSERRKISSILKNQGYEIIEAANGKDALSKLNTFLVQLIITDVKISNDELDLVKEIRANPLNKFTPIIMMASES